MSKGDIKVKLKMEQLGLSLAGISEQVEAQLQEDIRNVAYAAYAQIMAKAQEKGGDRAQDYIKGLSFDVIGKNEYLISLDGDFPNKLETGWPEYDAREAMLKSRKIVTVGSRAGLPWVQIGKAGQKYAHVPMEKRPFTKNPMKAAFATAIQNMKAPNSMGKLQKITKIFTDPQGNPLSGKVAVMKDFPGADGPLKNLQGLIKYQQVSRATNGKTNVASTYMVYRTISENGKAWKGAAFEGIKAFMEAEAFVDAQISEILKHYLG